VIAEGMERIRSRVEKPFEGNSGQWILKHDDFPQRENHLLLVSALSKDLFD